MHINITEAEQKILNLLWEEGCFSTMQITDKLKNESGWSKQAVISFLKEWKLKSWFLMKKIGRAKYYTPLPKKEIVAQEERNSFLQKLLDDLQKEK